MSTTEKPNAPSVERNREAILEILTRFLSEPAKVLEIGSGTSQHAIYFADAIPHLIWQASDMADKLEGMQLWHETCTASNLPSPIELNVAHFNWPISVYDALFTANTLHIMAWPLVEKLIVGAATTLKPHGQLIIYGPFNYEGQYTSESNAKFDQWLKERDAESAIRDFELVVAHALEQGFELKEDIEMPANNHMLIFKLMA